MKSHTNALLGMLTGGLVAIALGTADARAGVRLCEFNVCHVGTGNCQPVTLAWKCDEVEEGPGCRDCDCENSETCPF